MILWTFRETTEGCEEQWRPRAFRLTLQIERWSVGLIWQHQDRKDGRWYDSHTDRWELSLARQMMWGAHHMYYDGPHCTFALGRLRFQWMPRGGWCEKCMPSSGE